MVITEETQVINNQSFPPEANIMSSCTVYNICNRYLYILCDHRAFMSPESCSKVLGTAGKPSIHLCHNRDHINQGHVFFSIFTLS